MSSDYPFADGHNLVWDLTGFSADEEMVESATLTRDQFLAIRHLFVSVDDPWMVAGEYRVAPGLWPHLRRAVPGLGFQRDADYYLGARQALPDGRFWRPAVGVTAPGPIPPP